MNEQRLEAIKRDIRGEKDSGTSKEDLINMTLFPNEIIEEVFAE